MKLKLSRVLAALMILLLGACAACSSAQVVAYQPTHSSAIDRALHSTISLNGRDGDPDICAGTRVSATHIVTAFHCAVVGVLKERDLITVTIEDDQLVFGMIDLMAVDPALLLLKPVTYRTYDQAMGVEKSKKSHKGLVVAVDPAHDIAIIATDKPEWPYVAVAAQNPEVGQPVFAIGHPIGLTYSYTEGALSNPCRYGDRDDKTCYMQIDIHTEPGSSGGGLFNEAGELMGNCSYGISGISGFSFFSTTKALRELLFL